MLYYNSFGKRSQYACLNLWDVNIPEHGTTDLHLERLRPSVQQALGDEGWVDIAQDLKRQLKPQ